MQKHTQNTCLTCCDLVHFRPCASCTLLWSSLNRTQEQGTLKNKHANGSNLFPSDLRSCWMRGDLYFSSGKLDGAIFSHLYILHLTQRCMYIFQNSLSSIQWGFFFCFVFFFFFSIWKSQSLVTLLFLSKDAG